MSTLDRLAALFRPATGRLHLPGPPPLEVVLRRSARARRMSLRVSRIDGAATLTLPPRVPEREAMAFLAAQEGWLRRATAAMPVGHAVGHGTVLPVEGQALRLLPGPGRSVRIEGDSLIVPGLPGAAGARVAAWARARARDRLAAACDRHAATLGRRYTSLVLRDTRSRWGSCSSAGRLMFSWRLILAPPRVLDYVAAHEVAHLARMDHSPAFWATVAALVPDYATHRAWLKAEGNALHAFRFADAGD
ncbi:MAG: M48 family metallopeptidase [Gemmobacter sp.]